jgi:hypothetical protein
MKDTNEIWVLNEKNPWPDNYIAIFCTVKDKKQIEEGFSRYKNIQMVLYKARYLKTKYGAKQIRIFYPTRASIIIN